MYFLHNIVLQNFFKVSVYPDMFTFNVLVSATRQVRVTFCCQILQHVSCYHTDSTEWFLKHWHKLNLQLFQSGNAVGSSAWDVTFMSHSLITDRTSMNYCVFPCAPLIWRYFGRVPCFDRGVMITIW